MYVVRGDTDETWKKVGGRWSQKFWSWVVRQIKSNDQIATTWSEDSSGTDGAIKYEDIVEEFNKKEKKKFVGASQWSLNDWISILAKGGGAKKRFHFGLNPNSSRHIS